MIRLAELIHNNKQEFLYSGQLDTNQFRCFHALSICRRAEAGGSFYTCLSCGFEHYQYHSCGNRFCPTCQNHKTSLWLYRQKQRLLNCTYFMVTFTLHAQLRQVPREDRAEFFKAFFTCSSQVMKQMVKDRLKGELGMIGVLHTHGRDLCYHPHIHYIIPAVILDKTKSQIRILTSKFFLHNRSLANLFRGKFLNALTELLISFPTHLYGKQWNVDCRPVGQGLGALKYLSSYLMRGVV